MKMTGDEFCESIEKDPSWCLGITEPTEITTYINIMCGEITHLSPLITFTGKNIEGWSANFYNCKNLKVATGRFAGAVDFSGSGVEKIENLYVEGTNIRLNSASFWNCKNLKVASGTYKGSVSFNHSGVTTIKNLKIKTIHSTGEASFVCPIEYIPKEYRLPGYIFNKKSIENTAKKDREDTIKTTINKIKSEANNIEL